MNCNLKPVLVGCLAFLTLSTTACSKKDILHWLQDDDKNTAQSATATTSNTATTKPAPKTNNAEKEQLVNDLIGVWQAGRELIIMNRVGGKFQLLIGERFIPVTVGDIDPDNKTVNLLFTDKNGKKIIWTVKKILADDNKAYHLRLTSNTGEKFELEFVRKVGTDDLNHIEDLAQESNAVKNAPAPQATTAPEPNTTNSATTTPTAPSQATTEPAPSNSSTTSEDETAKAKQAMDSARKKMNQLWNSATPEQKSQLQSEQEAWIAHRDKVCNAESEEKARLECLTKLINERYTEMQEALK